jgi:hypothetical protein
MTLARSLQNRLPVEKYVSNRWKPVMLYIFNPFIIFAQLTADLFIVRPHPEHF